MPKAKSETVTKPVVKKPVEIKTKTETAKADGLSVPVYGLDGEASGNMVLPEDFFGAKVNQQLLAQAARVYLNNQTGHFSHTKTRGEVRGSTRKIRVQKGTGGARHGAVRAPIFVGGGIALGPKSRKTVLELPAKMKQAALKSALSARYQAGEVMGIKDLDQATGKTKQMQAWFNKIAKKDLLLVVEGKQDKLIRAIGNLQNLDAVTAQQLNVLSVLRHRSLALTKEAAEKLGKRGLKVKEENKGEGK